MPKRLQCLLQREQLMLTKDSSMQGRHNSVKIILGMI